MRYNDLSRYFFSFLSISTTRDSKVFESSDYRLSNQWVSDQLERAKQLSCLINKSVKNLSFIVLVKRLTLIALYIQINIFSRDAKIANVAKKKY